MAIYRPKDNFGKNFIDEYSIGNKNNNVDYSMIKNVIEKTGDVFLNGTNPSHSGNISGNIGYLGSTLASLRARIIIDNPNADSPTYGLTINNQRYNRKFGYPCNEISGSKHLTSDAYDNTESVNYTEFSEMIFTDKVDGNYSFPTNDVLKEIYNKLKEGVFI